MSLWKIRVWNSHCDVTSREKFVFAFSFTANALKITFTRTRIFQGFAPSLEFIYISVRCISQTYRQKRSPCDRRWPIACRHTRKRSASWKRHFNCADKTITTINVSKTRYEIHSNHVAKCHELLPVCFDNQTKIAKSDTTPPVTVSSEYGWNCRFSDVHTATILESMQARMCL